MYVQIYEFQLKILFKFKLQLKIYELWNFSLSLDLTWQLKSVFSSISWWSKLFNHFLYVVILYQRPKALTVIAIVESISILLDLCCFNQGIACNISSGLLVVYLSVLIRWNYLAISLCLCKIDESVFVQVPKCRFPLSINLKLLDVHLYFYTLILMKVLCSFECVKLFRTKTKLSEKMFAHVIIEIHHEPARLNIKLHEMKIWNLCVI